MSVDTATIESRSESNPMSYSVLKRVGDIAGSGLALVVLSPVMGAIALFVVLQDRGPVLYSQDRVGRDGKTFRFYKFRSMVRDADRRKKELARANEADGPIFKMKDDPRVTAVGRFLRRYSLDELPQFWNVLRGDMSLVGPRPHLPTEIANCADYPRERLSVPPGIVCLREVGGRSELTFRQWLESDLEYVRRRSIWLDLSILLRAIPAVLFARGAY